VHPAIKKVLCEQAGNDRRWLAKVRPWWNHYYHFHVRVKCPPGASDCKSQKPLSNDDGCGQELTNWYEKLKKAAIAGAMQSPATAYDGEASAGVQHSACRWRLRASACQCWHHAATGLKGARQQGIWTTAA
jgi:murein endopeptidase